VWLLPHLPGTLARALLNHGLKRVFDAMKQSNVSTSAPSKPLVGQVFDLLASVKFAVAVVIVVAVVCVAGTILPQGADAARYVRKFPAAAERMQLFNTLGLTHVFASWWFIGLLCVLSASVATCSTRRFATVRRTKGYSRGRAFGSMLTHISFLLILGGAVIRGVWGQKGYVEFREGETVAQFMGERGPAPLPFAIHLQDFEIETYNQESTPSRDAVLVSWPAKNLRAALPVKVDAEQQVGSFTLKVLRYLPDFVVDTDTKQITSRSDSPRNPAVLVAVNGPGYQNHRWLFARFPDMSMTASQGPNTGECPLELVYISAAGQPRGIAGPIKSFKSTLDIVDHNAVVLSKTIEVNSPLSYKGYTLYQSGYNPDDLSSTTLQVVKDPGVPVVYAGFGLMILGLSIVFYLNPWLNDRRKS
jgi:hypothetical protein